MGIVVIGAMVPWYTLRLLPLITFGTAKVNLLDVLIAIALLLALTMIIRATWRQPALLWVCAFIIYMSIPLAIGLRTPDSAFLAIREARPLAFYALALVFATAGYRPRDYRFLAIAYVVGTTVASAAVFAHVLWLMPLPGYQDFLASSATIATWWPGVQYLEQTVLVVAFLISLIGAVASFNVLGQIAWMIPCVIIGWYIFATGERFIQILVALAAATIVTLSPFRKRHLDRIVLIAAILAVMLAIGLHAFTGTHWLKLVAANTLHRWAQAPSDNSLRFRKEELVQGLPRFAQHPLFGEGLGGIIISANPLDFGRPWRYIACGYGFLLVKTGMIGLILYLGMAFTALRRAWRAGWVGYDTEWPVAFVGIAGIGILLAFNLFRAVVDIPEGAIAFSLFYGMAMTSGTPKG